MRQRGLPRSRNRGKSSSIQYRWPPTRGPSQTYKRQRRPQRLECTCPKKRPAFRLSLGGTCWLRHVLYASDPLQWYVAGAFSQMHLARAIRYVACQCILYADGARLATDQPSWARESRQRTMPHNARVNSPPVSTVSTCELQPCGIPRGGNVRDTAVRTPHLAWIPGTERA